MASTWTDAQIAAAKQRKYVRDWRGRFSRVASTRAKVQKVRRVRKVHLFKRGHLALHDAQMAGKRVEPPTWDKIKGDNARRDGLKLYKMKKAGKFPSNVEFYKEADRLHREFRKAHPNGNFASKNQIANAAYRYEWDETGKVNYLEWPEGKGVTVGKGIRKATKRQPTKVIDKTPGGIQITTKNDYGDHIVKVESVPYNYDIAITKSGRKYSINYTYDSKNRELRRVLDPNGYPIEDVKDLPAAYKLINEHEQKFVDAQSGKVERSPVFNVIRLSWGSTSQDYKDVGIHDAWNVHTSYGTFRIGLRDDYMTYEIYEPENFGDQSSNAPFFGRVKPWKVIRATTEHPRIKLEDAVQIVGERVGRDPKGDKAKNTKILEDEKHFQLRFDPKTRKYTPKEFAAKVNGLVDNMWDDPRTPKDDTFNGAELTRRDTEVKKRVTLEIWHLIKEQYPEVKWRKVDEFREYKDADIKRAFSQGVRHQQMRDIAITLNNQLSTYPWIRLVGMSFQSRARRAAKFGGLACPVQIQRTGMGQPIPMSSGTHIVLAPDSVNRRTLVHELGHAAVQSSLNPDFNLSYAAAPASSKLIYTLTETYKREHPRKPGTSNEAFQKAFNEWVSDHYPETGLTNYSFLRASIVSGVKKPKDRYVISHHESLADSWEEVHIDAEDGSKNATSAQKALADLIIEESHDEAKSYLKKHRKASPYLFTDSLPVG